MDFQIKEPVHPLIGAMNKTNQLIEFEVTQEYTGQQLDLCYLGPMWTEVMNWKTYTPGVKSDRAGDIPRELSPNSKHSGYSAVGVVGRDNNWVGNKLSQINLYAFGRLCWDNTLSAEQIAREWVELTFPNLSTDDQSKILHIEMTSRDSYRNYTQPLGNMGMFGSGGWDYHYGVLPEGQEWNGWGFRNIWDRWAMGRDRTVKTGSKMTGTYHKEVFELFENIDTCPDDVIGFFHHVNYTHKLHSGETVIQHIYDSHFAGVEAVLDYQRLWSTLREKVSKEDWNNVWDRLAGQLREAIKWRDQINTYAYRHSGIPDEHPSPSRVIWP
jgi:alpha-glucuronidase